MTAATNWTRCRPWATHTCHSWVLVAISTSASTPTARQDASTRLMKDNPPRSVEFTVDGLGSSRRAMASASAAKICASRTLLGPEVNSV